MVQSLTSADVVIVHHNTCACVTKCNSYQIQIIIFVIAVHSHRICSCNLQKHKASFDQCHLSMVDQGYPNEYIGKGLLLTALLTCQDWASNLFKAESCCLKEKSDA